MYGPVSDSEVWNAKSNPSIMNNSFEKNNFKERTGVDLDEKHETLGVGNLFGSDYREQRPSKADYIFYPVTTGLGFLAINKFNPIVTGSAIKSAIPTLLITKTTFLFGSVLVAFGSIGLGYFGFRKLVRHSKKKNTVQD